MKTRLGFVSNSSSSSFICDITGVVESGMDMSLEDAGMVECINGHTFSEDFLLGSFEDVEKQWQKDNNVDEEDEEDEEDGEDDDYYSEAREGVPEKFCPICQLQKMTKDDMLKYLLKKAHLIEQDVIAEVAASFKSYKDLAAHLK